jgi:hypothetical protein
VFSRSFQIGFAAAAGRIRITVSPECGMSQIIAPDIKDGQKQS